MYITFAAVKIEKKCLTRDSDLLNLRGVKDAIKNVFF